MKAKERQAPGKKGEIFVISAPSGSGKTTLVNRLIGSDKNLWRSISVTTRGPRAGEINKKDYFFLSEGEFRRLRRNRRLAEWAKVFGNYYGTPLGFLEREVKKGNDVVLTIDVQGALKIKKKYPEATFIFVMPPGGGELRRRLETRRGDTVGEIAKRLKIAEKEISFVREYDYLVVNDRLSRALKELQSIIAAERCRVGKKGRWGCRNG